MAMALFGEIDDTTIALGGKIDHVIIAGGRLLTSAARRAGRCQMRMISLIRHPEIPSDDQPTLSSKYLKSRGPRYTNIRPVLRFFIPFAIGFQLCFLLSSTKNTQETFFGGVVGGTDQYSLGAKTCLTNQKICGMANPIKILLLFHFSRIKEMVSLLT